MLNNNDLLTHCNHGYSWEIGSFKNHASKGKFNLAHWLRFFSDIFVNTCRLYEIAYGFGGPSEKNVSPHKFSIAKYQSCVSS